MNEAPSERHRPEAIVANLRASLGALPRSKRLPSPKRFSFARSATALLGRDEPDSLSDDLEVGRAEATSGVSPMMSVVEWVS